MADRIRWSESLIESEIRAIAPEFGRMPTANELRKLGKNPLAVIISRRGGFREWARRLGLDLKSCATHMGIDYELYVKGILESLGSKVDKMTTKAPFDLHVHGKIRVNVKSAKWSEYGSCKGHFFGISDTWKRCDFFSLVKVDKSPTPQVLWVPSGEAQQQTITLTKRHRLNSYIEIPDALLPGDAA